jgi:vancomycin resistance protein YoaR
VEDPLERPVEPSPVDPADPGETLVPPLEPPGGDPSRRRILVGAAIAGAGLVLYAVAAWATSGSVARDTTVSGVAIGGLDRVAAITKLDAAAAAAARTPVPVKAGAELANVDVTAAGLGLDSAATVDDLTGFSLSPVALWRHVAGGGATDGVDTTDAARLDAVLEGLGDRVRVPSKDAAITFQGTEPRVTPAVVGTELDRAAAAARLRASWLGGAHPVELPVTQAQPKVTQEAAEAALRDVATPAVSGPLEVAVGARTVSLPPAKSAPALSVVPDDAGTLGLKVDGAKLREAVLAAAPEIGVVPKDARIELQGGRPVVVPAVAGVTIDPTALAEAARPALAAGDRQRRAEVETAVREPELTTAEAQKLGVKEQVSTFATILTSNSQRTENLRIAAKTVNGTLVMPGETFSLNGVLGERTPAKGYNEAPAISGGRLVRDFGGGVSQMATTIFNNVFFSGLEDVYHKPHSFYISRYPEGREATVNWPTVDLKWKNDSPYAVLIQAWVDSKVHVSFWSTKVWDIEAGKSERSNFRSPKTIHDDSPGCVSQDANGGFDVSVSRIFKKNGATVKTETFHTTYIAEDEVICGPEPKPEE